MFIFSHFFNLLFHYVNSRLKFFTPETLNQKTKTHRPISFWRWVQKTEAKLALLDAQPPRARKHTSTAETATSCRAESRLGVAQHFSSIHANSMSRNSTSGQCFRGNPLIARRSDMHHPEKPRIRNEAALD
jgi:hypothetical protein